ncbi:hypothetical protein Hdeb2414_s0007g00233931 [Helianthus debilis subsp. tardiflorus]
MDQCFLGSIESLLPHILKTQRSFSHTNPSTFSSSQVPTASTSTVAVKFQAAPKRRSLSLFLQSQKSRLLPSHLYLPIPSSQIRTKPDENGIKMQTSRTDEKNCVGIEPYRRNR